MLPHFDKYAPYIWWGYAIATAILVGLVVWSILRVSSAKKKLDEIEGKDGGDANG
ncbi:MAG: heme exporter protein CcmD [Alphaproteobacteria bacterium]|nr:heme exporter protein CcmD [Alphaproteobacteria bacterium]